MYHGSANYACFGIYEKLDFRRIPVQTRAYVSGYVWYRSD